MKITQNTKISKLLKHNSEALEVMVGLNSKFERLRNPLLRRLLASRTSIKEASRIGKCEVSKIVKSLEPLGFEYEEDKSKDKDSPKPEPDFVKNLDKISNEVLDVRQDIKDGKDPLKMIMAVVKKLPANKALRIINTFEPTPLINVLEKKGYEAYVKEVSAEQVDTFFMLKSDEKGDIEAEIPDSVTKAIYTDKLNVFGKDVEYVDVSMLEMPMPMVTILNSIEDLPDEYVLSVQHRRVPMFLFNELKERNFDYMLYQVSEDDVKLLIYHKK